MVDIKGPSETLLQKYVNSLLGKCLEVTGHAEYAIKVKYMDEPDKHDSAESQLYASIHSDTVYLWASVRIYPPFVEQFERGEFSGCARDILHEVCHIFVEPVAKICMWDASPSQKPDYRDVIERQTERICKALFKSLPDGWYTPSALGASV